MQRFAIFNAYLDVSDALMSVCSSCIWSVCLSTLNVALAGVMVRVGTCFSLGKGVDTSHMIADVIFRHGKIFLKGFVYVAAENWKKKRRRKVAAERKVKVPTEKRRKKASEKWISFYNFLFRTRN